MREKVVIVGGGVAGLTAAHELVTRGFEVHVYERRSFFGGKAGSYRKNGLPGEHGFRFFPNWYRHLTDTMARIPYHKPGGGRASVADNLVDVDVNLLAWFDRPPIPLPMHMPRNVSDAAMTTEFFADFMRIGLTAGDFALFFKKLGELVLMTDERRAQELEGISWWEYLECDQPGRSRAYQDFVRATTRTMVSAKAEQASAYTIGRLAVRTLLDTVSNADRVLNGPTNEVWIDPWVDYLKAQGVVFHLEMELQSIQFDSTRRSVRSVVMRPVPAEQARRLRNRIGRPIHEGRGKASSKNPLSQNQLTETQELLDAIANSVWLAGSANTGGPRQQEFQRLQTAFDTNSKALRQAQSGVLDAQFLQDLTRLEIEAAESSVEADHFILALPLEQVAYHVNRTTMLSFLAPEFRNVIRLSRHMDWMSGIQFYLQSPIDVSPGHIVGLDSTWALTAVEETQFWKDVALPPGVKAILSVDVSAWDEKGRITRKEAYNCTDDEIAKEVWGQLKEMLNKSDRLPVLRDSLLAGGTLQRNVSYHLDTTVVDLWDRRKQGFYERARGLRFNTLDVIAGDEGDGTDNPADKMDDTYAWGPRRRFNTEPMLINRPGSQRLRPEATTSIPNLFLAGDYIFTDTDLACMEGANEAARKAVNGILDATASLEKRCELWKFSPSRQAADAILSLSGAVRLVRGAVGTVSQLQDQFWKRIAFGLMGVRSKSLEPWRRSDTTTSSKRS